MAMKLDVIDAHAGGDVGRVLFSGPAGSVPDVPGATVAERARFLREEADGLRRVLTRPPRGVRSQSVNLVVPPTSADADVGLVVMGTMGYPNYSGSNAMCTVAALVHRGLLTLEDGPRELVLETPGGLTTLSLTGNGRSLVSVSYAASPGFLVPGVRYAEVGGGTVPYRIVYGGTFYALVSADEVGLSPTDTPHEVVTDFFAELIGAARRDTVMVHPLLGPQQPLSLGLLVGEVEERSGDLPTVPVAVYMDGGVIRRGPTGTGTTGLLTWLHEQGAVAARTELRVRSPYGHEFTGVTTGTTSVGQWAGAHTTISGRPHILGRSEILLDTADPTIDRTELRFLLEGAG